MIKIIPDERDFTSRLHTPAVAARVGIWLGICFGICFLTGLMSHISYLPHPWIPVPTRPTWGYRLTQGVHVITGTAAIPLLLVKLWTVYPKLFARPPRKLGLLAVEGAERVSIAVLVGAGIFQLSSGLLNISEWYPWSFTFRATHYAVAWIAIGALIVHIAVKLPIIRAALGADVEDTSQDRPELDGKPALSRRGLIRTALGASGVLVLATAGETVPWLRKVSVLAVRSGGGPQGLPVNRSAKSADVIPAAMSADFRLTLVHGSRTVQLSRTDLEKLPQRQVDLPIACVQGWSAMGHWTGVRLRDVMDQVGAPRGSELKMVSLQRRGAFGVTVLPGNFADDDLTTLALGLDGEALALDHGYPCRLVAPNRPGVLQTKWISRIEVLA